MEELHVKLARVFDDNVLQLLDSYSGQINWEKVVKEYDACVAGGLHRTFEIYQFDGEPVALQYRQEDLKYLKGGCYKGVGYYMTGLAESLICHARECEECAVLAQRGAFIPLAQLLENELSIAMYPKASGISMEEALVLTLGVGERIKFR